MDNLSQYHDAATRSVSVARMLWLLAEAARRDIPLSEVLADACNDNQKQGIPAALEILPAGLERKLSELEAALSEAEGTSDAVRSLVMRSGEGQHNLLGHRGVSAHDAAIALGRQLLPEPEHRLPKEQSLSLLDLATARMVNIHSTHGDAYHCLKEAESALEAERLGAAEVNARTEERDSPQKGIKRPSGKALQAWRLRDLQGNTQAEIATTLETNQGQVSRWLSQVKEYLADGNVLPELEVAKKPTAMDPTKIDMGARIDQHTPRQRQRMAADSED